MYRQGKIRALGVSNFNTLELRALLDLVDIAPHVVQNKGDVYHVGKQLDNVGEDPTSFALARGLAVVHYSR